MKYINIKEMRCLFLLFVLFLIIFFIIDLWAINSQKNYFQIYFYEKHADICKVVTNYIYKNIHYGGIVNWLAMIATQALFGVVAFGFVMPLAYVIDHFFNGYFYLIKDSGSENFYEKDKTIINLIGLFFILIVMPWIYNFFVYIILNFYWGEIYNCSRIIKGF